MSLITYKITLEVTLEAKQTFSYLVTLQCLRYILFQIAVNLFIHCRLIIIKQVPIHKK